MKAFITKFALTEGIQEMNVEVIDSNPNMVRVIGSSYTFFHGEGKDWHRTRESAVARAEHMRTAKLTSLGKSVRKLQNLKFT